MGDGECMSGRLASRSDAKRDADVLIYPTTMQDILGMTGRTSILLVSGLLLILSVSHCLAEDLENSADSELSLQQWQQRVEEARRRSEQFVDSTRTTEAPTPPSEREEAEAAVRRALNDPSLQPDDLIATGRGSFVVRGDSDAGDPIGVPLSVQRKPPSR